MCETRAALGCMLDLEVSDTNHTTTDMVACAHDATSASCGDLVANMLPASCAIKPGLRLDGQGCGSSWQCMSTHCEKSGTACGTCAVRQATGGTCTVDEGCQMGLVCANSKCIAPRDGDPCTLSNPRLDCVPPATCVGGVCRLPSVTTCN